MPAGYLKDKARIFPEQVRLLYRGAREAYIATAVNAVVLAVIQRHYISSDIVLAWLAYITVVTAGRTLLVLTYWRSESQVEDAEQWNRLYLGGCALAGAGWGSAGILLYSSESMLHQVFLAFVIGGMAAGSVAVLAPRLEVFFAFFLPALIPIAVRVALDNDSYHAAMTTMIILYSAALIVTACRLHRTIASTLALRFENADLVRHLTQAKEQADQLNEDLKQEIIERRKVEAQLRETQEHLEARVEERSEELHRKQAQLLQASKLASIGELATGVAHELNNPLNNIGLITGNLLEVLKHCKESYVPSLRENLSIVADQVRRATEIISSLRTFGRAAGTQKGAVNVHDAVTAAIVLVEQQLRLHNVDLRVNLTQAQPIVYGNALQLEQVFVNLLTNARDAVKQSETKIITINTTIHHDMVEVVVEDTGAGIAADDLKCIFDPFFTTKEVGQGTGLGLSISYGIIRDHGGTVMVDSRVGHGAKFTVRLPKAPTVRLMIDGIPETFTDEQLRLLFSPYGTVLAASVVEGQYVPSYRYGVVELATMEEAERARHALNRTMIGDGLILVFIPAQ